MAHYSAKSLFELRSCHYLLQFLFNTVIKYVDCSVICGYRNEADQNEAFAHGKSQLKYPKGRHNRRPSEAADVVPYPIDWDDELGFYHFAGLVKGIAAMLGIEVVWGGDWPNFKDLAHWELKSGS